MTVLLMGHLGLLEATFSSQSCNLEGLAPSLQLSPLPGWPPQWNLRSDVAIFDTFDEKLLATNQKLMRMLEKAIDDTKSHNLGI